jgi:hypothetical protein
MPVIREKRQAQGAGPVGVVRMELGNKYGRIADASQKLTDLAIKEMGRTSAIQGAQMAQEVASSKITSINPITGKPEALDWVDEGRFIGRVGAEAYTKVVNDRFQTEIENEMKQKAGEIALQYENDPYSAEKYEAQMTNYLQEMASASEANGKPTAYTNFIMSQGAEFITATKLNMMQERYRRQREALGESILSKNQEMAEVAFGLGQSGNFDKFNLVLDAEIERNKDGERARLVTSGASRIHGEAVRTAFVNGAMQNLLENRSEVDRAKIIQAVRTGNINYAPKDVREQLSKVVEHVDVGNKTTVLSTAASIDSGYKSIEAAQTREKTEALSNQKLYSINEYDRSGDALENRAFDSIFEGYDEIPDFGVSGFSTSIAAVSRDAKSEIVNLQADQERELITATFSAQQQEQARRSVLRPLLSVAAQEGNVESVRLAITRRDPRAMDDLTENQRVIVNAINNGTVPYDVGEDSSFVDSFLSGSVNQVEERISAYQRASEFTSEVNTVIGELLNNEDYGEDEMSSLIESINTNEDLTPSAKDNLKSRLNVGMAISQINSFDAVSSREMNNIGLFILSNGADDRGLTESQKATAQNIINLTQTEAERNRITTELRARESAIRTEEQSIINETARLLELEELKNETLYTGSVKSEQHRKLMDDELQRRGINILSLTSETPEFYQLMAHTVSDNLLTALRSVATGTSNFNNEQINVLLNHFQRISNDPTKDGMINRFDNLLGEDFAVLQDAIEIRNFATGPTKPMTEIIADLKNRTQTPAADANYKNVFGSDQRDAAYSFVLEKFNDPVIASELESIAEYYARIGQSKSDINNRLESIVNKNYLKSEYIIDPASPVGSIKKSRYSLSHTFPDEENKDEFLKRVDASLPDGYSILGFHHKLYKRIESDQHISGEDMKRVYLMPYGLTQKPQYYAYYLEPETNELRPLIYDREYYDPRSMEKRTELTWPMYDEDLVKDFISAKQSAKDQEEIEQVANQQRRAEEMRQALKRRPGFR